MKFSTLALIASAAYAYELNLEITSDNSDLNGKGIQPLHEGAGISYFGVSDTLGNPFWYNEDKTLLTQSEGQFTANVGADAGFLQLGPAVNPGDVTFDSEGNFNIGVKLFACKNLNDPYNYFADSYGIAAADTAPNDSCVAIGLKKVDVESSSAASTPAPTSSAHANWNGTTTNYITVTGYTTYCPEETTLTITTCHNNACGPKTITVSQATTVIVTEECLVPSTTAAQTHPTTVVTSTKPTTVAGQSTAHTTTAAVSSYEAGAAQNVAGLALGVVGVAALMI